MKRRTVVVHEYRPDTAGQPGGTRLWMGAVKAETETHVLIQRQGWLRPLRRARWVPRKGTFLSVQEIKGAEAPTAPKLAEVRR